MRRSLLTLPLALMFLTSSCSSDRPGEHALGKTKARVSSLCAALEVRLEDEGELPDAALGLKAFLLEPEREKAVTAFNDGWRRPVRTIVAGNRIVGIYSLGPDGVDDGGGKDDVACRVKAH